MAFARCADRRDADAVDGGYQFGRVAQMESTLFIRARLQVQILPCLPLLPFTQECTASYGRVQCAERNGSNFFMTDEKKLTFNRHASPMPKTVLVVGAYYIGRCRNACVARWDGTQFWYWRVKFNARFIESIKHRDDDDVFDVFDAWARVREDEVAPIEFRSA